MKSAIGEGMTRRDHGDVSNQLVSVVVAAAAIVFIHTPFLYYYYYI